MKESVDKKLKEHIINIFDNYDDGGAEQGWAQLRKKHPKNSLRALYWWSSAAAVLLISGLFYFIDAGTETNGTISALKKTALSHDTTTLTRKEAESKSDYATDGIPYDKLPPSSIAPVSKLTSAMVGIHKKQVVISPATEDSESITSAAALVGPSFTGKKINGNQTSNNTISNNNVITNTQLTTTKEVISDSVTDNSLNNPQIAKNVITNNPLANNVISNSLQRNNLITIAPGNAVTNNTTTIPIIPDDKKNRDSHNKKFELSFHAGAFLNYAEGSSNSMNVGAGVSSGIPLSKRVTLIAGLALAKNTLIFESELPNTSYLAFITAEKQAANLYVKSTIPQISKLEARLLNLDFPINIKYSLSREPDKVFVTAGISSFTYLNEAYHYSYNELNNGTLTSLSSHEEVINKNFGKFDLAQTLNFSFGLTHTARLQKVVVEPFIKYPIGALGSQDIRFGSAGINLKLNINPVKKLE